MGEFVKPWRRKIGVVTLLMALIVFAGSLRSRIYSDGILLRSGTATLGNIQGEKLIHAGTFEELRSADGSLFWNTHHVGRGHFFWNTPIWSIVPTSQYLTSGFLHRAGEIVWRHGDWSLGLGIIRGTKHSSESVVRVVPYWTVATPLVLLSAWLLLSKPQTAKTNESASATGESHA